MDDELIAISEIIKHMPGQHRQLNHAGAHAISSKVTQICLIG